MTWIRALLLTSWTAGFVALWFFLFIAFMLGTCGPSADEAACIAQKEATPEFFLIGGPLAYLLLTWLMFFRR
jgi:hypothetical protein